MSILRRTVNVGTVLFTGVLGCSGATPEPASSSSAVCVASEKALSPDRIDAILRPNIVQIVTDNSLGSGFMLDTGDHDNVLIVTNYHVIAEGEHFKVVFVRKDGTRANVADVEVVKTSPEHDLALLKAPRMTAFGSGLKLGPAPRTGQSVTTLGYPVLGETDEKVEPALSTGLVAAPKQTLGKRTFVQTNVQLAPGNSGGPAVDSCGSVIGVTAAHHAEQSFVGLLVPAADVAELRRKYDTPRRASSAEVSQRVEDFLRFLQESEQRTAATYFSREFLAGKVFPDFARAAKSASQKRQVLERALAVAEKQGYDVSSLTPAQLQEIAARLGIDLDADELHAQMTIVEAKQKGSDAYAELQAFFAPYLTNLFGKVDHFKLVDVKAEDDEQIAWVLVESDGRQQMFRLDFAYEWGDWQITDLATRGATSDDDQRHAGVSRTTNEVEVNMKR